MKRDLYLYICVITIGVLLWLLYRININFDKVQSDLQTITFARDSKGRLVATQKQQILDYKDAIKVLEETKSVSKVSNQTQLGSQTIIVEKKIPIKVEVIKYVDSSSKDTFEYIELPYTFTYEDTWNKLEVTIDPLDIYIDTLRVNNNFVVTVGEKDNGWFKEPTPIVEIRSDNPYTNITSVKNVTVAKKKPFYKTFWFGGIVGALTMLLIL